MTGTMRVASLSGELLSSWRRLVLALSVMLVSVVAASGYLVFGLQPRLTHDTTLLRQLRLSHEAMLDQETGLRAYVATGQQTFLEPYGRGARQSRTVEAALLRSVGRDGPLADPVLRMMLAEQDWRSGWARAALRVDQDRPMNRTQLSAFFAQGKTLFDAYREQQVAALDAATAERDAVAATQERLLMGTGAANILFVLALLIADSRRRRRLQRSVDAPLREVLAHMERMHQGNLTTPPQTFDVEEFQRLGAGLGSLGQALDAERRQSAAREQSANDLAARLRVILRVARETAGSLSLRYVAETVAAAAVELGRERATVWVCSDVHGGFTAVRRSDDPHGVVPPASLVPTPAVARAAADAQVLREGPDGYFPLVVGGSVVGVLETHDATDTRPAGGTDDPRAVDPVLEALALNAASSLESARLNARTAEQATMDALTGLPNRRRLESDTGKEWERARRYGRPLSICMLDLDHFKQINDSAGHPVGDAWLRLVAEILRETLRDTDAAYRYGGEEFLLLLPETARDQATAVAERLRHAIDRAVGPAPWPHVTASLGVATMDASTPGLEELVAAADGALYDAKRGGRNRVETAGERPAGDPVEPARTSAGPQLLAT